MVETFYKTKRQKNEEAKSDLLARQADYAFRMQRKLNNKADSLDTELHKRTVFQIEKTRMEARLHSKEWYRMSCEILKIPKRHYVAVFGKAYTKSHIREVVSVIMEAMRPMKRPRVSTQIIKLVHTFLG